MLCKEWTGNRYRNGFLYFQTVFCCQLQCLLFRLRIPDGFRRMGITAENGGVSFFAGDLPELLVRIPSFFHQTKEIDLQRNVSLFPFLFIFIFMNFSANHNMHQQILYFAYFLSLILQFFYHPCSYVYILYFIYPTF